MKKISETKPPILCIEEYREKAHIPKPFYVNRLSSLVEDFETIHKPHGHSFVMVMWVSSGSGVHRIDFTEYQIQPNQIYFLTPGQIHSWSLSKDTEGIVLFFEQDFFRSRFPNRLMQYPFLFTEFNSPKLDVAKEPLFSILFEKALLTYKNEAIYNEVILSIIHLLLENSDLMYRQAYDIKENNTYHIVFAFEQLIQKHYVHNKEVNFYADLLAVSPNYLNQTLKKITGKTAITHISSKVIIEAKRLLVNSKLSSKEIAYELGFESDSYFSRFFKKHTSVTPMQFRGQH